MKLKFDEVLSSFALNLNLWRYSMVYLHLMLDSHNPDSMWRHWGLAPLEYGQLTSAIYLKVSLSDFLTLFSARTHRWFWSDAPAWCLIAAAFVALGRAVHVNPMKRTSKPPGHTKRVETKL